MWVKRLGPVIDTTTAGYDPHIHDNINGPSLIRVPDWVENPLGRYYLYFAHHKDDHIRMAHAEQLTGPYTIYPGGVFSLAQSRFIDHIASPDVHVDHERQHIRVYHHGPLTTEERERLRDDYAGQFYHHQWTRAAISTDGLNFEEQPNLLELAYLRVFPFKGHYYGIVLPGLLMRSSDGLSRFERGPLLFARDAVNDQGIYDRAVRAPRHFAVQVLGDRLRFFYSLAPDTPESIYMSEVDASGDWHTWEPTPPQLVLAPETDYEGGDLPIETSQRGRVMGRVRQLRDPAIYEEDGRTYLLYSTAGESGIAIAELID